MTDEKRRSERIEILGDLEGAATVIQPVSIKELSRTGALIESPVPLHVDSLHQFRLNLGATAVVVHGRIAHCRIIDVDEEHVMYSAGVDFVGVSDAALEAISRFVESLKAERRVRS
jgi:hypothetical protein